MDFVFTSPGQTHCVWPPALTTSQPHSAPPCRGGARHTRTHDSGLDLKSKRRYSWPTIAGGQLGGSTRAQNAVRTPSLFLTAPIANAGIQRFFACFGHLFLEHIYARGRGEPSLNSKNSGHCRGLTLSEPKFNEICARWPRGDCTRPQGLRIQQNRTYGFKC